jgi:hypothetical protein
MQIATDNREARSAGWPAKAIGLFDAGGEEPFPKKCFSSLNAISFGINLGYEIVRYESKFKEQVIGLQTNLWSPSSTLNNAYFEWKYERNPYLAEPLIYLATHDDEVVGMRGFFGNQWEIGFPPQTFSVLYADDAVVAPDHRKGGLIHKIMTAAFKDLASREYQYVFNLSAGPVIFHQSLSMGWRSVGYMQLMRWRPWMVTFQEGLNRVSRRLPSVFGRLDTVILRWLEKRRRSLADIGLDESTHFCKKLPWISFEDRPRCTAMAELVERIGSRHKIRHIRDQEYFEWRFQNPLSRYRFLFHDKTGLNGYLVLQEYTSEFSGNEVLNVVDWEGTSVTVKAELLQAALSFAVNRSLIIWSATLPPEMTAVLCAKGYKMVSQWQGTAQQVPALIVRPIRDENLEDDWLFADRQLLDLSNWELRMLYSMLG